MYNTASDVIVVHLNTRNVDNHERLDLWLNVPSVEHRRLLFIGELQPDVALNFTTQTDLKPAVLVLSRFYV